MSADFAEAAMPHQSERNGWDAGGVGQNRMRLSEVIGAFSYALDLTEGQPDGHSLRCAWIGMHMGRVLGLAGEQLSDLYYTLLLKDAGCGGDAARLWELYGGDERLVKHRLQERLFGKPARARPVRAAPHRPWRAAAQAGAAPVQHRPAWRGDGRRAGADPLRARRQHRAANSASARRWRKGSTRSTSIGTARGGRLDWPAKRYRSAPASP